MSSYSYPLFRVAIAVFYWTLRKSYAMFIIKTLINVEGLPRYMSSVYVRTNVDASAVCERDHNEEPGA